nr:hypothetical protein [Tanacetum cinerariifolium]
IENLVDKKVKVIRCDNRTEFKNSVMNDFCAMTCIRKEFSVARTPQQNGVAERRNRTLIMAARTMALVVKPHNKTPYELFRGRTHALSFIRPFRCHVTILNSLDPLGKFDEKANEGYFVGYSMNSNAFRVYNIRTRRVEENLHIEFLENKPIVAGAGLEWLFDSDMIKKLMNYVPVFANGSSLFDSSPKISNDAGKKHDEVSDKESGASNELNSAFEKLNTNIQMIQRCLGKKAIGIKWIFRNKKEKRGIVINNKSSLCFIYEINGVSDGCEECFLYERIEEEVYVCQPQGFEDPDHPDKKEDGIFISQDKYVTEVLRKFNFSYVMSASTPVDTEKPLVKDTYGDDVDVHLYRSMIGSLMYLTASRPDNMKSTTEGCQFLGSRLISWQCKKQTVVAISTTEAEYMAAASCCG